MDRVVSARLDADLVERMDRAAKLLGMSKRQFLEEAIAAKAADAEANRDTRRRQVRDALAASFGLWRDRPGTTAEMITSIRADVERMLGAPPAGRD
jgi:predicted transcriptional regulator